MTDYILRNVEDSTWKKFHARAEKEGRTLRWVLLRLLEHYIRHGLPSEKQAA